MAKRNSSILDIHTETRNKEKIIKRVVVGDEFGNIQFYFIDDCDIVLGRLPGASDAV